MIKVSNPAIRLLMLVRANHCQISAIYSSGFRGGAQEPASLFLILGKKRKKSQKEEKPTVKEKQLPPTPSSPP